MENKEFEVAVYCRQRAVYRVAARDADEARRTAIERWQRDEQSDLAGFDWCELDYSQVTESPDRTAEASDEDSVLRKIQERERRFTRSTDEGHLDGALNDAVSAGQIAADLGWYLTDERSSQPVVDAVRAGLTLERLCSRHQLICFERARVREGERGDIRLYCTPAYLEQLSASMDGSEAVLTGAFAQG